MPKIPRYLVTTADERTWKFDRPVLFLGEWCRIYERKHIWQDMSAIVAAPFGLAPEQQHRDLAYVQRLADQLLTELADSLNGFHQTQHSRRYWHIVLGSWLQKYVAVAFNRYHTLEQALSSYDISSTLVFDSSNYSLATADFLSFMLACGDDVWNHVLYARVLEFLGFDKIEVASNVLDGARQFVQRPFVNSTQKSLKQEAMEIANLILPKLCRANDAFIINSYLPKREELKLQLSLRQVPQFWRSPQLQSAKPDKRKRQALIASENSQTFERFVRQSIGEAIPTCHLEGYRELTHQAEILPWPSNPKFIFTSNNYSTDEIFKVWAAAKVEQGIPYFIGQHGNNYGTLRGTENIPDVVTCDKFLTWGWTNGSTKNIPAFVFTTAGKKPARAWNGSGLLLIEVCLPNRVHPWDTDSEFSIYQAEQFRFAEKLPNTIRQQLTVRLHADSKRHRWSDSQRWSEQFASVRLEDGTARIQTLIAQSRLVVYSYDSTGILECLNLNIPCLCFWHGGLEHLLSSAKPYYELLRNAGILCDSPEQAAELVSSRWQNIASWWMQPVVQDAREAFCAQYARRDDQPIRTLRRLLISGSSTFPRGQQSS